MSLRETLESRLAAAPLPLASLLGLLAAFGVMPLLPRLKPLFPVPGNGIGLMTIAQYPKAWDYAVVSILFAVAFAVTLLAAWALGGRSAGEASAADREPFAARRHAGLLLGLAVLLIAALTFPIRDDPYQFVDPYHEGESLSPASVMMAGGRPYRDVFFMHAVATDGGIDLLAMGNPPSPVRARRAKAVLNALTLAMLVVVAAEISPTFSGALAATLVSLAATGAFQLKSFPYFRVLPLLLMVWWALRFLRTGRRAWLIAAASVASAGMLWSFDVGVFAVGGFWGWMIGRHFLRREGRIHTPWIGAIAATLLTPVAILLALRASIPQFIRDGFRRLPECFDAVYSLPAPPLPELRALLTPAALWSWIDTPSARYFMPPIVYGALVAGAFVVAARGNRKRAEAMMLIGLTSLLEFRSAAGRVAWSHTRFAVPLLGVIVVSLVLGPLVRAVRTRRRLRWASAIGALIVGTIAIPYIEVKGSAKYAADHYRTWESRRKPAPGLVPWPLPRGRGLYTYPQEAADLTALYHFSQAMPAGPIFDFSGEKDLYYMLARPASTRCHDIPYLADPKLAGEARRQLERRPPVFVVVKGIEEVAKIDGVTNAQRTPWLASWIDDHYPVRTTIGRFTVGLPPGSDIPPP